MGSTLNRMIFWELVRVFLLSLGTLTSLFLIVMVVQQADRLGLSLTQIIRAAPLLIPSILPITIPQTTLFAACVVYGRLSHDNEVIALKSAGIHLFRIMLPALLLGVITTGVAAALHHSTIPETQKQFHEEVLSDPEEVVYNMLRRDHYLRHPSSPYVLYVRDVQDRRLIDVIIMRRAKPDPKKGADVVAGYDVVARVREAQLHVDLAASVISIDSEYRFTVYEKNASGSTSNPGPFQMDLPDSVSGKEARMKIDTLTWDELQPAIATTKTELDELIQKRDARQAEFDKITDPYARQIASNELAGYQYQIDAKRRHLRNLQSQIHYRPALAVSCFVFALIGCPVGVWANRADYLSTFLMCFLPTLLIYYPLMLMGTDMGKNGRLPLWLGCWLADIVVSTLGSILTWRLLRR